MLFRKKIDRACKYCLRGTVLEDGRVLCVKKGIQPSDGKCLGFRYDPLKRIPVKAKPMDFSQYDEQDFSL